MMGLFANYNVYAKVNHIYLTSPFSYHIVKEVTKFHLYDLARSIGQRGYRIQFLNETEYGNIVHALEIRTGEFLRYGDQFINSIAIDNSAVRFDPFLNDFLEGNNIADTSIWMYLKNIKGTSEDITAIREINLGVRTGGGRSFDFTLGSNMRILGAPPVLSYQIHHNLLRSLEDLLRRENIPPDHTLTLYLKDLSPTNTFVDNYRDIERVNIGVIVEDEEGRYIKELDWIVEETKPQLVYTASSIIGFVITSFHEPAHELVRRALVDDMSMRASLSIVPSIELHDGIWIAYKGVANVEYTPYYFSKAIQINKMAVLLAGEVAEEIIISNNNYYEYIRTEAERDSILMTAYIGICLGLGRWQRDIIGIYCPNIITEIFYFSSREWSKWKDDLPEVYRASLMEEANEWMREARLLARNVLIRNFGTLEDITNLVLREGILDTQDLENFYQNIPQIVASEVTSSLTQPPFLFNDTLQIDILNRNLSLLSSLVPVFVQNSRDTNFQQVQNIEADTLEILEDLRRVEVTENLRGYIRSVPMEYEVHLPYASGLSSLYIKECIRVITDFFL